MAVVVSQSQNEIDDLRAKGRGYRFRTGNV